MQAFCFAALDKHGGKLEDAANWCLGDPTTDSAFDAKATAYESVLARTDAPATAESPDVAAAKLILGTIPEDSIPGAMRCEVLDVRQFREGVTASAAREPVAVGCRCVLSRGC